MSERLLARLVHLTLDHGEYDRRIVTSVAGAKATLESWQPHLVIIDLDLDDGGEPVDLIGLRRHVGAPFPIIALTRSSDMRANLTAFERGVDDLLTVPFAPEELIARALAVMRRVHGMRVAFLPTVRIGELEIDLLDQRVIANGQEIPLTRTQRSLLYVLAAGSGMVMSRDQLLEYIFGRDAVLIESNVIDRHVRDLRLKLGDDPYHPRYIETVAGTGYRFLGARSFPEHTSPATGP
ncbi:MAG: response regulator transcription factor [Chloroflexota bacterium]|nr:response regulator transcription factor [Chloroflexota bacterium]